MPNTNINKFAAFVIVAALGAIVTAGCSSLSFGGASRDNGGDGKGYEDHVVSGTLESADLREASGIAASKCQMDVFWVHNDSGDEALLYAIDAKGKHLGVWKVGEARNRDWEDIAAVRSDGKCFVLIGDIGDNGRKHERLAVYRVEEPTVAEQSSTSSARSPISTATADVSYMTYPNERHDAEALLVHPTSGEVYLATKSSNTPSHVYKFRPRFEGETQTLTKVGEITVPAIPNGSITGGDISSDGQRLVLCDYFAGYEWTLPDGSPSFDAIWKERPRRIDLGERAIGEAAAYAADGSFVIAVSEKRNTPVNIARRRRAN